MRRIAIPADLDDRIRHAARQCCGYCLSPQQLVMVRLEIEHIIPLARGGSDDETISGWPARSAIAIRVRK